MCSMKWAAPASSAASRREPARTYAAMETERAPGIRAEMTRGPPGSTVRSNIAPILPDAGAGAWRGGARSAVALADTKRPASLSGAGRNRTPTELLDERLDPILREVDEERRCHCVHEPVDFAPLALDQLDEDPRDEARADADGDVIGQRHEDDGQEGRQAVLDVGDVDVLDEREHQVANENESRGRCHARHDAGDWGKEHGEQE